MKRSLEPQRQNTAGSPRTQGEGEEEEKGGGRGGLPGLVEGALALHRINGTDPLSRATTPSGSSNKSRSLGTPGADPRCWGQLREIGLSGADAHLTR